MTMTSTIAHAGEMASSVQRPMGATGGVTVSAAARRYLSTRQRRGELAATTAESQRYTLRVFVRAAGPELAISQLDKRHVRRWWDELACSPSTARNRLSAVRSFLDWCVDEGLLRANPARTIKPPREPRRVPRALDAGDVAAVLDACSSSRDRLIVTLMVQMGLRCCEVAGLHVEHLDRQRRLAYIVGKGGHERVLPVPDEAWTALSSYLAERPASSGPLVRRHDAPHLPLLSRTISGYLRAVMRDAGVKQAPLDGVSAHALRRTCASDLLDAGAHVRQVQQVLGHASLRTTEVYLRRVDAEQLAEVMEGRRYSALL